jgi:hypothetical protein
MAKRYGKAFIVTTSPFGGYTSWHNSVPRGKLSKRGNHVEFTKFYTHCFPFRFLQPPKPLRLVPS